MAARGLRRVGCDHIPVLHDPVVLVRVEEIHSDPLAQKDVPTVLETADYPDVARRAALDEILEELGVAFVAVMMPRKYRFLAFLSFLLIALSSAYPPWPTP